MISSHAEALSRPFVRTFSRRSLKPLVACLCSAGLLTPALAVDRVWFGGNGDWDVSGNWSPLGVPGSSDKASLLAGTATLSVDSAVSAFSVGGGALIGTGNLAVSGTSSWTGGTIGGYGGNVVTNGGLQITGATGKSLGNYYGAASSGIVNNSAATWSGSGNLSNYNSGRFTNGVKGTFDIQTDADFLNGTLVNQGSLVKSVGATDGSNKTVVSALFNNSGSVNVQRKRSANDTLAPIEAPC